MIIEINNDTILSDIQDAFREAFPFLGIEFFAEGHPWGSPSPPGLKVPAGKTIGELRTRTEQASMEIHGWHTTGAVEQEFGKIFGQNEAGRNAQQELFDGTDPIFNSENPVET
jgi:hypothetical protein